MTDPFRILVTGSRHCTDEQAAAVRAKLDAVSMARTPLFTPRRVVLVHGQCPHGGVDLVAHRWAEEVLLADPEPHPADWDRHGRSAGPIRNAAMVATGASICLAFPATDSRGTWDCIRKAADAGIPVQVWPLGAAS